MDWLKEDGYTHCFFVGGGNVMHLLEAASRRFECVAVVHEVAAGIAAEYRRLRWQIEVSHRCLLFLRIQH
jgi:thiamine pyrophosphate-dependent acetolactate synthase large subunit-like protein